MSSEGLMGQVHGSDVSTTYSVVVRFPFIWLPYSRQNEERMDISGEEVGILHSAP